MKWIKRGLLAIAALLIIALIGIFASGNGRMLALMWDFATGAPDLPFEPAAQPAPPPDYSDEVNWAALPTRDDLADMTPAGIVNAHTQGNAPVDVFFVHPTGFLKGSSWTFDMKPNTSTEENTQWMMANNASPYNGCCNVYAPRYRQASIFTYFSLDEAQRQEVLGFAYQDVERAFDYFIKHYNDGRPFVLASHSQGTHHSIGLLRNRIDGTPLAKRMVAAYLIGGFSERKLFSDLEDVALCDSPTQLHCVVHWDTYSEAMMGEEEDVDVVCTNPLTWRLNGGLAGKEMHKGAVPSSGEYYVALSGDDSARGVEFKPFGAPMENYVEAQCQGGRLFVTDQSETEFGKRGTMGDTYHGLDYPLFYMDIRENAILRVNTFFAGYEGDESAQNTPAASAAINP